MSCKPVMSARAIKAARTRELKRLMKDVAEFVEREARLGLAELDRLQQPAADAGLVIEAGVEGNKIVIEAEAEPGPKASPASRRR
jgi:hypothetical protein